MVLDLHIGRRKTGVTILPDPGGEYSPTDLRAAPRGIGPDQVVRWRRRETAAEAHQGEFKQRRASSDHEARRIAAYTTEAA